MAPNKGAKGNAHDQTNPFRIRFVVRARFGRVGPPGGAKGRPTSAEPVRHNPGRARPRRQKGKHYGGHKNYKHYNYKHYNKHYNYKHGRYYHGGRYWGRRYYYRPPNWQAWGCVVVGPVWYCP